MTQSTPEPAPSGTSGSIPGAASAVAPPARPSAFAKQAIIVVHGMGEQRPMDTLKSFVRTIWQDDQTAWNNKMPDPAAVWSKPDGRSGSLELRRITTRQSSPSPGVFEHGVRNDFWELYWADLTAGTPWEEFCDWLWNLLRRDPRTRVPRPVLLAWCVLWALTAGFILIGVAAILPEQWNVFGDWRWLALALAGFVSSLVHAQVQKTFGRVARYTRATPNNIAARKAVRERGMELLGAIHADDKYDRIILVSHSLGTIVAYELLAEFWARQTAAKQVVEGSGEFMALCALERAGAQIEASPHDPALLATWLEAQRNLRLLLAHRPLNSGARWIISDFVTLGSPLTHAEFLMATDKADLEARQRSREMPTCPPWREMLDPDNLDAARKAGIIPATPEGEQARLFCFPLLRGGMWELHHAAPFAVVRWTNIFDPTRWVCLGDLISGPVRYAFGPGIKDVDLGQLRGQSGGFTHLDYWKATAHPKQLQALRDAVNLLDRPPRELA